jgi:formate hydrogenlyase subunit 5
MTMLDENLAPTIEPAKLVESCAARWPGQAKPILDLTGKICHIECRPEALRDICEWLMSSLGFSFATLVAEERPARALTYVLFKDASLPWVHVEVALGARGRSVPSLSGLAHGPSVDWHEREVEDLFGIAFEGHPRLGEFVLHEDWPEGVNPMQQDFDAGERSTARATDQMWQPPTVVTAPGAFAMPIGPVFSDFAESAHFRLETVGEDVIRTIPRFFYNYRGVEKIAEGQSVERVLLLAERFSGIAAFAHGLAFCQAAEAIAGITIPPRARTLRMMFAELERLRHHAAVITGICNSTALAVAAAHAALIEEDLIRLSCTIGRHRYLFGLLKPGGLACDVSDDQCQHLAAAILPINRRMQDLHRLLRYSSSFLDRLEEVGPVTRDQSISYGLVGPIARASGVPGDFRRLFPYADYDRFSFTVPVESQGDGYARLRVFFDEAELSTAIIHQAATTLPSGPVCTDPIDWRAGVALGAVEAPQGAAFHWLRIDSHGVVVRYRVTPPAFPNWHGFHLAAENFAFQDFPIILASFGLSNAECDR